MTRPDRALLLADPERLEDHHRAARDGAALRPPPGEHRQGRPVQGRLPADLAEQPHAGDHRPRRAGRQADLGLRVRRDPAVPRPQDRASSTARTERERVEIEQWLFWQVGGVGPMAGPGATTSCAMPRAWIRRTSCPTRRTATATRSAGSTACLNRRLADRDYVAGGYSIADMAIWPWANGWENQQQDIERFPHMKAWLDRMSGRARRCRPAAPIGKDAPRGDLDQGPRGAEAPVRTDRPRLSRRRPARVAPARRPC